MEKKLTKLRIEINKLTVMKSYYSTRNTNGGKKEILQQVSGRRRINMRRNQGNRGRR